MLMQLLFVCFVGIIKAEENVEIGESIIGK